MGDIITCKKWNQYIGYEKDYIQGRLIDLLQWTGYPFKLP